MRPEPFGIDQPELTARRREFVESRRSVVVGLAIDRLGPEVEQLVDPRVAVTSTIGERKWTDVRGDLHASNADVRISTVAERGEPEIERLFHEHLIDRRIEVERLQVQRDADLTELLSQRLRQPLLIRGVRERDGKPLAILGPP